MKKVFWDSNIYRFIVEKNEEELIGDYIHSSNIKIYISNMLFIEALQIPDEVEREKNLSLFSKLIGRYHQPIHLTASQQLLKEIKRSHPEWIDKDPLEDYVRNSISFWKRRWKNAKKNDWVYFNKRNKNFRKSFYNGALPRTIGSQKDTRKKLLEISEKNIIDYPDNLIKITFDDKEVQEYLEENDYYKNDDKYDLVIRTHLCNQYVDAFIKRNKYLRDLVDYLGPYIYINDISEKDWIKFWYVDIDTKQIPLLSVSALTSQLQVSKKVTSGNSGDQALSMHILTSDLFFTCDKSFYDILINIKSYLNKTYKRKTAKLVLIDRSQPSGFNQIISNLA